MVASNIEHGLLERVCNEFEIVNRQIAATDNKVNIPIRLTNMSGIDSFIDFIAQRQYLQ